MSVVKRPSNKLPRPATLAAGVCFGMSAQGRRCGFRRWLLKLLFAGWVPHRPLFVRGFPCLIARASTVHRPHCFHWDPPPLATPPALCTLCLISLSLLVRTRALV